MMSENPESSSKVLQINTENVYKIFECNELVVLLFCSCYENPCIYESTFKTVSVKVSELYPDPGKVVIGKASRHGTWTEYYSTPHYSNLPFYYKPSVRLFINGKLATKSFISDITVSNIVSYIQKLLDDSISEISSICIPNNPTNAYEKFMIGYFKNKNSPDYQIFKKCSMVFMGDCQFYAGFGEEFCTMYSDNQNESLIIFKISNQPSPEFEQEIFSGDSSDYESLYNWGEKNILYSTSEITFDNAEEMLKDRPPSLILFYNPDDLKPVKRFKDNIKTVLKEYCNNTYNQINFLTANGALFSKHLQEIEKSQTDLPFLLLVRRGTIYQFPENYNVTSLMSYQQLKVLIKDFFTNNHNFKYYSNERRDKSRCIHPVYRFNLFCEFSSKPEKIDRNYMPDSVEDYFCVSLFDE
ncbi:endoplasmic reticulum resident protein 44-like isoform X2 [Metopolophium dirhodum]|uniref:endoplasmic reticulum resident protein 44-like isoform X2 n=1 Tax=Metopolophium dirhodum TaxID=44670 RepID=UPI00298FA8A3|nr:endoplasmic reticulum resident protein 44-like isoform X2 [Metopolophium dirhodum]